MLDAGRRRVGDGDPAARRVEVGVHVQPPVAGDPGAGLGVQADGDLDERRGAEVGGREVGDPHVGARRRARGGRHDQPAPVAGDRDAVVVGVVEARAEHLDVVRGRGAQPVQPDAAVVLRLVRGELSGGSRRT